MKQVYAPVYPYIEHVQPQSSLKFRGFRYIEICSCVDQHKCMPLGGCTQIMHPEQPPRSYKTSFLAGLFCDFPLRSATLRRSTRVSHSFDPYRSTAPEIRLVAVSCGTDPNGFLAEPYVSTLLQFCKPMSLCKSIVGRIIHIHGFADLQSYE